MRILIVSALALVALAGCSSSGSPATSSTDAATEPPVVSAEDTAPPTATGYDALTCAEWLTSSADDQKMAAVNFAAEYNDPHPTSDAASLASAITTVCQSYGDSETPTDIAKSSVAAVYGG